MTFKRDLRYFSLFIFITIVFYYSSGIIYALQRVEWKPAYYFLGEKFISVPIVLGVLAFLLLNKDKCKFNLFKLLIAAIAAESGCQLLYWGQYFVFSLLIKNFQNSGIETEMIARLWVGIVFDVAAALLCTVFFCWALLFSCKFKLDGKSVTKIWIIAFVILILLSAFTCSVYYATTVMTWGQLLFMGVKVHRFQGIAFKAHLTLRVFTMLLPALWFDSHISRAEHNAPL